MTGDSRSLEVTLGPFFGVVARGRPYLNTLYLLLAFPLGLLYFIFLVTGISLGLGLIILWVGLLVLLLVVMGSRALSALERQQAIWLLGAEVGPMAASGVPSEGIWARLQAFLANSVTWKGLAFISLKFPLGLISFVFVIVSLCVSLSLLLAPFYYWLAPLELVWWYVDRLWEALICSAVGLLLTVATLHAINGLAFIWRGLAELLLGHPRAIDSAAPA